MTIRSAEYGFPRRPLLGSSANRGKPYSHLTLLLLFVIFYIGCIAWGGVIPLHLVRRCGALKRSVLLTPVSLVMPALLGSMAIPALVAKSPPQTNHRLEDSK